MIDYNMDLLNDNNLTSSFFHLSRNDPMIGFPYDASSPFGPTLPIPSNAALYSSVSDPGQLFNDEKYLVMRLCLGSHLAQHLRHLLEEEKGYTSTAGISTNKLISKLVGNVNKPKGQTTLLPPYNPVPNGQSNVNSFIDDHDIGKLPGVGFKIAQKIRAHFLGRAATFDAGLVYGGTKENVKVRDVRLSVGMCPEQLGSILNGPGVPGDLAERMWGLLNGVDNSEVAMIKEVPQQISIVSHINMPKEICF